MCLNPIQIKDATFGYKKWIIGKGKTPKIDKYGIHDSPYMYVPCGHCSQCIAIHQMEMAERIQMEALNNYIFMGTITYKNEVMPKLITSTEYEYRYADYTDVIKCLTRLRENNAFGIPFRYLAVTERGSKRARPHAHILFSFRKEDIGTNYFDVVNFENYYQWTLLNEWRRPYYKEITTVDETGKEKTRKVIDHYKNLSEYHEIRKAGKLYRNYDFHYVNPRTSDAGVTDAAFYVLKYLLKNSTHEEKIRQALKMNLEEEEYRKTWQAIKSRANYSLGFGLDVDYKKQGRSRKITEQLCNPEIIEYLKQGIEQSKKDRNEYAYYYVPGRLDTYPLANYYKRFGFIYTPEDEEYFYQINPERYRARYLTPEHKAMSEINKQIAKFNKIINLQKQEEVADYFDEIEENGK